MSQHNDQPGLTYEASGVSIEAQDRAIEGFREQVEHSHAAALASGAGRVLAGVGSFGAAFAPDLGGLAEPVLVSSTDGIGTKVRLHARFGTHGWAGEDLVAAVTNDVLCQGARPLFFLDYLACNKVAPEVVQEVVGAMGRTCASIGCALVGGEIAEMGDVYQPGEYDLAGFCVGLVDAKRMWSAEQVRPGDALVGLASNGMHCNGFSLVRAVFEALPDAEWRSVRPELESSLHDALLAPTRCYAAATSALLADGRLGDAVHAAAHISGGGLVENMPRAIPPGLAAVIDRAAVRGLAEHTAAVFDIIGSLGRVSADEMWRVFNMGVGFVLVVEAAQSDAVIEVASQLGFGAAAIGKVEERSGGRLAWLD